MFVSVCSAASMSCSHVTGLLMSSPASRATDLRYQRSWVFAQKGAATISSFHIALVTAGSTTSSLKVDRLSSGTDARYPASANSATKTGSIDMMSTPVSPEARRRNSC